MHIVVTGATGVIGRAAIPNLVARGHSVLGLHQHAEGADALARLGATSSRADLFDPAAVRSALDGADVVVHLATAIPPLERMARLRHWAINDRLRSEATRVLVDASIDLGVERFVVESVTFNYVDSGDRWVAEDDPVAPVFAATASALVAEQEVARFARQGACGVSLRFAQLYGPDASDALVDALRGRRVPLVGSGRNYVSSVHVDDAGRAVAAALDAPSGCFNVCDDAPMRSAERLALQARSVGAPAPRRVPASVARLLAGRATHQLTVSQRVLNRRFRDQTGWTPQHPSISSGWSTVTNPRHTNPTTTARSAS